MHWKTYVKVLLFDVSYIFDNYHRSIKINITDSRHFNFVYLLGQLDYSLYGQQNKNRQYMWVEKNTDLRWSKRRSPPGLPTLKKKKNIKINWPEGSLSWWAGWPRTCPTDWKRKETIFQCQAKLKDHKAFIEWSLFSSSLFRKLAVY